MGVGCFTFNSMCRSRSCFGSTVAAGIPACRRAGLPSPAEKAPRKTGRFRIFQALSQSPLYPGGKDAALYVRQGCLTPQSTCPPPSVPSVCCHAGCEP